MSWRKVWVPVVVGAALAVGATVAVWLRTNPAGVPSSSGAPRPRPDRPWHFESLPALDLDQTLTLLVSEASSGSTPGRLRALQDRIDVLLAESLRKIEAAGAFHATLPEGARRRFAVFRAEYARRHDAIHSAVGRAMIGDPRAVEELEKHLRATGVWTPPPRSAVRGNLSGPQPRPTLRAPRASEAEWRDDERVGRAGAPPSFHDSLIEELLAPRAAWAQEAASADLGPTPEVVITEAIRRLAVDELGRSPARIVSWVRQNVEFAPVHGALRTSESCLLVRRGTAADMASLTIALLRAAGTPARYRAGTVRIPIEQAKSWLGGFEDANSAASLLATGGTPALVELGRDGQPAFLRFEHVWVSAHVDFVPGRGVCAGPGDTWVSVDAAIKSRAAPQRPDLADLLDDTPGDGAFDAATFRARMQAFLDTATSDPVTGALRGLDLEGLESFLDTRVAAALDLLLPASGALSVAALAGLEPISGGGEQLLAAAPPFVVLANGWERPDLPESLRWRIKLRLEAAGGEPVLAHELPAPSLGSSRFAIGYAPGEGALEILVPQLETQPDSPLVRTIQVAGVSVIPRLLLNGIEEPLAAPAVAVPMGATLEIVVELLSPTLLLEPMRAAHVAGALTAIAIDLESVPRELFDGLRSTVDTFQEVLDDPAHLGDGTRFLEAFLSTAAHGWFQSLDRLGALAASAMGCAVQRLPSAGVVSSVLSADNVLGLPLAVTQGGLQVDMPGDRVALIARDGSDELAAQAGIARGFLASSLESLVPAELYHELYHDGQAPEHWLASANALRNAILNGDDIALLEPGPESAAALSSLQLLPGDVETIRDALERGLVVYTHTAPFRGASGLHAGFVILDPVTGGGSYRVSSGASGGEAVECSSCTSRGPCCNSPQGCQGPLDFFLRFWSGQYKDKIFSDLVGKLPKAISGAIQSVTSVIDAYTKNANLMDAALASFPADQRESLRPLLGMAVLMAGLQAVSDLFCPKFAQKVCGQYLSIVQGTAWNGVRNVLLYRARTDLAIEGVDMSLECLEQLLKKDKP